MHTPQVLVEDCSTSTLWGPTDDACLKAVGGVAVTSMCAPVREEEGSVLAVVIAVNKKNGVTEQRRPTGADGQGSSASVAGDDGNDRSSVLGEAGSGAGGTMFTPADLHLLISLCTMMRVTIRQKLPDAVIDGVQSKSEGTNVLQSLVHDYVLPEERVLRSRSSRSTSFRIPSAPKDNLFNPKLKTLDFNAWDFSESDLMRFTIGIFRELGLLDTFRILRTTLTNFVIGVRKRYRANPFHCWHHGFSVMQFVYFVLLHTDATNYLQAHDVLSLLVGALCHDMDHPGNTNSFEIATGTSRAIVYNDISVLENYHAHQTFVVLYADCSNIFNQLDQGVQKKLRKAIVKAIMSTDMSHHFDQLKALDSVVVYSKRYLARQAARLALRPSSRSCSTASNSGDNRMGALNLSVAGAGDGPKVHRLQFNPNDEKDRQTVMNVLVHTADLSAQVYPWETARVWEDRINMEFMAQAAKEKQLGLPVLPHMDNLEHHPHRFKMQVL